MNTLRFQVDQDLVFELQRAASDVVIKGWDQDQVELVLDGDPEQCTVEQREGVLRVESRVPFSATVPRFGAVHAKDVRGDLVLRDLDGQVSVVDVHGECLLQSSMGPLAVQNVHGDLTAEQLNGPLSVGECHSDVRLRQVAAEVSLGQVRGDLRVRDAGSTLKIGSVSGDVRVRDIVGELILEEGRSDFKGVNVLGGMDVHLVRGDLSLKTVLPPGLTYNAHANGDIVARFPLETSAHFTLEAGGTLSAVLPQVEEQTGKRIVGQVGEGETQVTLQARSDLSLKIRGVGEGRSGAIYDEDFATQIEAHIAERLGGMDFDVLAQREIEKAMRKAEREIEKAQLRVEKEARRAEERARRAQERAAKVAQKMQQRFSHKSRQWEATFGQGGYAAKAARPAPKSQVSDQEQLTILRMVQEGTISVQEAEKLLKALGG